MARAVSRSKCVTIEFVTQRGSAQPGCGSPPARGPSRSRLARPSSGCGGGGGGQRATPNSPELLRGTPALLGAHLQIGGGPQSRPLVTPAKSTSNSARWAASGRAAPVPHRLSPPKSIRPKLTSAPSLPSVASGPGPGGAQPAPFADPEPPDRQHEGGPGDKARDSRSERPGQRRACNSPPVRCRAPPGS